VSELLSGICADGWCAVDRGVGKVATLPAILNFEPFMMLCLNACPLDSMQACIATFACLLQTVVFFSVHKLAR
jgi:hypothetical protein